MSSKPIIVPQISLFALQGIPTVSPGDSIASLVIEAYKHSGLEPKDGDIVVLAQKIVSKAEDRYVDLRKVIASESAQDLSRTCLKDPRLVQCILDESIGVVRCAPNLLIVRHRLGFVVANAGIDQSNISSDSPGDWVLLLPQEPDASAASICDALCKLTGRNVGVAIIDSWGRAWRLGTSGACLGAANVRTVLDLRGKPDLYGRSLQSTIVGIGDELAAGASLLMGQAAEGTPIVVVRGAGLVGGKATARDLIRPISEDQFV
ncbi:coenzyme F420-0:L-glutamate ligase [Variovorax sp. V118]|uniref:coenzyme F420-0:L-glutamate ligase n=1 Tax=Variovorax sp. V118 TaxID=3065954 RepID=UPI0034E8573F